jgi:hypothetical protein
VARRGRRGALAVQDGIDEATRLVSQPHKPIGRNLGSRHAPSITIAIDRVNGL